MEEAEILLNYPVVYIHTWTDKNGTLNFYVGETIDLVRRTDEHKKASDDALAWQQGWINGSNRKSFYFSSKVMNKSLTLDLEDCLIALLSNIEKIVLNNITRNSQGSYSNKYNRNYLLEEIWNIISGKYHFEKLQQSSLIAECNMNFEDEKMVVFYDEMSDSSSHVQSAILKMFPNKDQQQLLFNYPVIYMHVWKDEGEVRVYVGETNELIKRTEQHLDTQNTSLHMQNDQWVKDEKWRDSWLRAIETKSAYMLVFGHKEFNKSITLDIENRLIQYGIFLGISQNGRTNEQKDYNNSDKMFGLFNEIVEYLNKKAPNIFSSLSDVKEKSIFMASPFCELTTEQKAAKEKIISCINDALGRGDEHTVIVVQGGAGTGKTVLASSLFFTLLEKEAYGKKINSYFIVNHEELLNAYSAQTEAWKLGQDKSKKTSIWKAETFINSIRADGSKSADVVLIDEAHLLNTKANMGVKEAQLPFIVRNSKVTVLMFDPRQFVKKDKHWEGNWSDIKLAFQSHLNSAGIAKVHIETYDLSQQMRMKCADTTKAWIASLSQIGTRINSFQATDKCSYHNGYDAFFRKDDNNYEIGIFRSVEGLKKAIQDKKDSKDTVPSALLATYNWVYPGLTISDIPWHVKSASKNLWTWKKKLEAGATHDIQGFDLQYAGVILGGSIQYDPVRNNENGKRGVVSGVQFNSSNPKHYGLPTDNTALANELIANELKILFSRGAKGLYIYAMNEKLQKALIDAINT